MCYIKLEEVAFNIVGEAAGLLRDWFYEEKLGEIVGQGAAGDDTRLADQLIEDYIVSRLKSTGLDLMIITEEKGVIKTNTTPRYIALIDPLDGSLNYVSKVPVASISLVFYDYREPYIDKALAGAVSNVFTYEIYSFDHRNVYLNKTIVKPSYEFFKGLISVYTEKPYFVEQIRNIVLSNFNTKPKFRTLGSAALESTYAGLGRIDLFIHNTGKLRNLDVAGGIAIALKLGVHVSDLNGKPIKCRVDSIERIESIVIGMHGEKIVKALNTG